MPRLLWPLAALACAACHTPSSPVVDELSADPARLEAEAVRVAGVAAGQGRQVLLYFHASWCAPCETLKRAFRRPHNRAAFQKYFLVKVDVDALASTRVLGVDVDSIPLLARLRRDGQVAGTLSGEVFGEAPEDAKVDAVLADFLAGAGPS